MKLIDILVEELPKRGGWPIESNGCRQFPDGEVCFSNLGKKPDFYTECATDVDLVWRKTVTPHVSREQYEAALAAKNEGWIEWGGGVCPVQTGVLVDVRYDDGVEEFALEANMPNKTRFRTAAAAWWRKDCSTGDIIAYRLHRTQEEEQTKADLNERIEHDAAPVWNGEGLPPVGCECRVDYGSVELIDGLSGPDDGDVVRVVSHEKAGFGTQVVVVYWNVVNGGGRAHALIPKCLRPLRTEADKKREAAIKELTSVICGEIPDTGMATAAMYAARVYDAGYRKEGE